MQKHILVVDDNPVNQMVLKVIINTWSNTTTSFANNGAESLEILRRSNVDLVLMDLQMPVMDGFEATIAIRNEQAGLENARIPIIAVTTENIETSRDRAIEIGMNDFMNKPVDHHTLFEKVALWLS
jgi:CheY-like chemotaxis protein